MLANGNDLATRRLAKENQVSGVILTSLVRLWCSVPKSPERGLSTCQGVHQPRQSLRSYAFAMHEELGLSCTSQPLCVLHLAMFKVMRNSLYVAAFGSCADSSSLLRALQAGMTLCLMCIQGCQSSTLPASSNAPPVALTSCRYPHCTHQ